MSATDYFRRNCWISTECDDPFVADVIRWLGDDHIVFETDFPHPDSKYPHATDHFLALLTGADLGRQQAQGALGQRRRPLPVPGPSYASPPCAAPVSVGLRRPYRGGRLRRARRGATRRRPSTSSGPWLAPPEEIERMQLAGCSSGRWPRIRCRSSRRRWDAAGFDPRRSAASTTSGRVPSYTVDDIRRSIEAHPPWGDYQGVTPADALREPMRVYMSGGTTGKSRPTFYTQWDREVGAVLMARALYMQGIRPGDVVLNSWAYGTHNGAFSFDEALYRWLNCVVLTTGTGNVTSSERQVELADRVRRHRHPHDRRLPAAPGRRRPRPWATTRAPT